MIEQAHVLHRNGKAIALTIDDAHQMPAQHLRKLRLLLEDTPGNYGILLFAQTELFAQLALVINEDLRSRITCSAQLQPLTQDDIAAFILREFDRSALAHSRLSRLASDCHQRQGHPAPCDPFNNVQPDTSGACPK